MAAEQMKKVAIHLTCPICYELYRKPKYLPCYHSYCEECLVKLQKADSTSITCPECRIASAIPTGGIKQLPNNFFINRIVDEVAIKERLQAKRTPTVIFVLGRIPRLFCVLIALYFYVTIVTSLINTAENIKTIACHN